VNAPFEKALETERELFRKMLSGTQSGAQRHAFFAERQTAKIPDVPDDTPSRKVRQVGIVGAGTMGGGIAMNFLNTGLPVTIVEVERAALDRGIATIRKNYENSAKKGKLTQDEMDRRMGLVTPSLSLDDLKDCDLVIEAVFERMDVKKKVFGQLERIANPAPSLLPIPPIWTSTRLPHRRAGRRT